MLSPVFCFSGEISRFHPGTEKEKKDPDDPVNPARPVKYTIVWSEANLTGACPVKYTIVWSEANLTGARPVKYTIVWSEANLTGAFSFYLTGVIRSIRVAFVKGKDLTPITAEIE